MDLRLFMCGLFVVNCLMLFGTAIATETPEGDQCYQQKYKAAPFVVKGSDKRLEKAIITCTAPGIIFEIRYSNESLCACQHLKQQNMRYTIECQEKLTLLNIILYASINNISRYKESCDVFLRFFPTTDDDFQRKQISITRPGQNDPTVSVPLKKHMTPSKSTIGPKSQTNFIMESLPAPSSNVVPFSTTVPIIQTVTNTPVIQSTNPIPTPIFGASLHSIATTMVSRMSVQETAKLVYHVPVVDTRNLSFTFMSQPNKDKVSKTTNVVIQALPTRRPNKDKVSKTIKAVIQASLISRPNNDKVSKITKAVIQASPTTPNIFPTSTLSPMAQTLKKLEEDVEFISNFNSSVVDINDKQTIERVLDAATNLITTNQTLDNQKQDPGMQAVEALENLGNSISQQLDLGNETSAIFQKVNKDLVFGVAVINTTSSQKFSFPSNEENVAGDEKIVIPSSVFNRNNSDKAYFVGIIFRAYREMRDNTGNLKIGTKVINAIVSPSPSNYLDEPVEMTFEKNVVEKNFGSECSFWIENSALSGEHGRWSTRQCFATFENQTHIKCACNHFTNFAVLFKITDEQHLSEEHTYRLVFITYIGLSLSILGCLLTFIIYLTLQNIKSERATIHMNLVVALGAADLVFLATTAFDPVKDSCLVASMLAFYFYLCVFFWMLVEGVYIYLMVRKVFRGNVGRKRRLAYLVGWGCPLLIAIITWALLRDDVVSKYYCWLSVETGAIWAFVGPGLVIILINCIILLTVVKTTWATFSDKTEYGGVKSALKTFGALIPILGITWVFGVMAFNESSTVFQYIFAITNSIQGVLIFVLYCLVNNEVRNELRRRILIWKIRRDVTSSSGIRRHILTSTQSAKEAHLDLSQDAPVELRGKEKPERSSLLDEMVPTETKKGSETTNNTSTKGERGGPDNLVKNNTIVDNSWDSIGYV